MGTGYTRNDTANNIADGNIINASDLDGEFDAVQSAFNASTGHTHDGTAGEGAPIETIGPSQDVVATASVLRPKTDNTVDLGTTSLEYKDLFLDGTAHIDTLDVDENASITGTLGVTGATTLSSTLGVTGATTLSSTLGVTGAATLSSTLGVTGAATLSSTLAVTGATGIDGDFDINTNKFTVASATGNTAVAGTLGVTGATTATGGLNVDTISEITSANGVVIDGVTLKDGGATVTADVTFGDNDKAIFGAGSDLQIYHDGSSSRIVDAGTGSLKIQAENFAVNNVGDTENMITAVPDGAVQLFYDNSSKLATTNTGIAVTGNATFADNGKAIFGAGSDLQIYHDGSNSYIKDAGTGNLNLQGENLALENTSGDNYLVGVNGSFVKLYHSGSEKLATTSTGIQVTGNIANTSGNLTLDVAGNIILDADGGFIAVKDAGVEIGNLGNYSSDFAITASVQDKDIIFKGNDNGSIIDALTLDMSDAGKATFNSHVALGDSKQLQLGADADMIIYHDGSTNYVQAAKQDSDLILRGNDGGTGVNALTLDMSEAGNATFNGTVGTPAGSAAAPAYTFSTDTNTGMFKRGTDQLGFSAGGTESVAVTATGIFTDLVGAKTTNGTLSLKGSGSGSVVVNQDGADQDFRVESDSNANALFVDAGNNSIGTGTGAPATYVNSGGIAMKGNAQSEFANVGTNIATSGIMHQERYYNHSGSNVYEVARTRVNIGAGQVNRGEYQFSVNNGAVLRQWLDVNYLGNVTFNEGSYDSDFRVESDSNANGIVVDASINAVGIMNAAVQNYALTVGGTGNFIKADNGINLRLETTDADAGEGPLQVMYRDSASPADGDILGQIYYQGRNDAAQTVTYALVSSEIADASDGTEDGKYKINTIISGNSRSRLNFEPGSTTFNDDSQDINFYFESNDNNALLFLDGGNNHVNIGSSTDRGGLLNVDGTTKGIVVRTTNSAAMELIYADNGAGVGPYLYLNRPSSSPAADDQLGRIIVQGKNSADEVIDYVRLVNQLLSPTDGSEQGRFAINTMTSGTMNSRLNILNGESVFNDESVNVDFRVESDSSTHALFVDAGANAVHINGSTDVDDHPLVVHAGTNANAIAIRGRSDDIGEISFFENDATTKLGSLQYRNNFARLDHRASGGRVRIQVGPSIAQIVDHYETGAVFNESGSGNIDFRVESDSNTHALFVDAGSNRVSVGSNAPNATFGVQSTDDTEPTLRIAASGANGTDSSIRFQAKDSGGNSRYADIVLDADRSTGAIKFFTDYAFDSADEVLTLDNEGAVFNEGSASNKDFRVETDSNTNAIFATTQGSDEIVFFGNNSTNTNSSKSAYFNVSDTHLYVAGENRAVAYFNRNAGSGNANGDLVVFRRANIQVGSISVTSSSTSYNTSSDHRLKENVVDLTGATTRLKQLEPKRFNFIVDANTTVDGFLAHEVQTIVPEAITGTHNEVDADGNPVYQGIDQSKLVPLLVATIKELEARITALENA